MCWEDHAGLAMTEGDLVIGRVADLRAGDDPARAAAPIQIRSFPQRPCKLWPGAVIPYVIADDFDSGAVTAIREAMTRWQAAGIRFEELRPTKATGPSDGGIVGSGGELVLPAHVSFEVDRKNGCWANGIGASASTIGLPATAALGCAVHEIGHAVGFQHEHARPDRGKYIDIFPENIEGGGLEQIFPINDGDTSRPYDVDSIMHYTSGAFAKAGTSTLLRKGGGRIEHEDQLSAEDVASTRHLYQSGCSSISTPPGSVPTTPPPPPPPAPPPP